LVAAFHTSLRSYTAMDLPKFFASRKCCGHLIRYFINSSIFMHHSIVDSRYLFPLLPLIILFWLTTFLKDDRSWRIRLTYGGRETWHCTWHIPSDEQGWLCNRWIWTQLDVISDNSSLICKVTKYRKSMAKYCFIALKIISPFTN